MHLVYGKSPASDSSLFYFLQLILFLSFSLPFLSASTTVFCCFSLLSIFSFSFHFASCLCWLVINRDGWFLHPYDRVLLKLTVQSPPGLCCSKALLTSVSNTADFLFQISCGPRRVTSCFCHFWALLFCQSTLRTRVEENPRWLLCFLPRTLTPGGLLLELQKPDNKCQPCWTIS